MTHPKPTADRAYAHVRERLLDGRYAGGELLSERGVATELGLSSTPVREAFLRLQAEGFLRLYPKRGALVVPVTPGEAHSVLQARLLMELFALDSLAARGPEAMRETAGTLPRTDGEGDADPGKALDIARDFHTQLMRAGGNPTLTAIHERLWDQQIRVAAASTTGPGHAADDIGEHAAITEAIRRGEGARARELLTRHISAVLHRTGLGGEPTLPPPAA
ncbi:GntR family transcriptional regulator [Streptomyces sp. AV19]|uniref:GntR family transcriptional regulator n=1 Tax=Streptomyces sp. AV19 TaxID=2793068 RepID=UPI0018FE5A20|nr:GntR family transcriptional regulator [Streptomyces sp. AV19]MBH1934332.1 GntR family transcriptional regulator [Streptomyces sp. AV19]MDG4533360.1 GntR family transcriptional regulator [Streptomyces sp. AV19]